MVSLNFEDDSESTLFLPDQERDQESESLSRPTPWLQVTAIFTVSFAETVVVVFAYPFLGNFVRSLDKTQSPTRMGYILGLQDSICHLTAAAAVLVWGGVSDHYGRKYVMLACCMGLATSLVGFGSSKTITALIFWKAFQGLFRANKPIIKTAAAELARGDEAKMAKIFGIMPAVYAAAATVGPLIGGTFAEPYVRFPSAFDGPFWRSYPYLLPCLLAACGCVGAFLMILMIFNETLPSKRRSLIAVEWTGDGALPNTDQSESVGEHHSLTKPSRRLVMILISYALIVTLDLSFSSTFAFFLSAPVQYGGLGFSPGDIGMLLGVAGIFHGIFQALFFARIHTYWEPRKVYAIAVAAYIPIYLSMPIMNTLARNAGRNTPMIWVLLAILEMAVTFNYTAFSCMYIFITQACPSPEALGRTHAAAQTVFSIMGAIGPVTVTSLVVASVEYNLLGGYLAYIIMAALSLIAALHGLWLPIEDRGRND
ncbi:MFS general substrate transporter [Athelia psychrophila]|uniref:MFS general substrate transporter n=1 Tax=Athelia psychrophila TaxID=1759441 RepID=A0A167VPA9_9AGAM|nr:MFS general substrate transporter [Fibularhizoctonia sp. CBS 109695]